MSYFVLDDNGDHIYDENGNKLTYTVKSSDTEITLTNTTQLIVNDNGNIEHEIPSDHDMKAKKIINQADGVDLQDSATMSNLKSAIQDMQNLFKPYISIWGQHNGPLTDGQFDYSFGDGANSGNYGYPVPINCRVKYFSISATAGQSTPGTIRVNLAVNGLDTGYQLIKPENYFTAYTAFQLPLKLSPGDRLNFISKSTNTSVTQSLVSVLIELDISPASSSVK